MIQKFLGVFGLILLLISVAFGLTVIRGENLASTLDDQKKSYGVVEGPPPCTWEVKTPERVISENTSQSIVISVNNSADTECQSALSLRAPGFDIAPTKEEQNISLVASKSGSLSWILAPRKTGTFEIAVSDMLDTKIFGITVTNTYGLTAAQAKIFSVVGSLFGPMFTIPWWWEKLRLRKQNQQESKPKSN